MNVEEKSCDSEVCCQLNDHHLLPKKK